MKPGLRFLNRFITAALPLTFAGYVLWQHAIIREHFPKPERAIARARVLVNSVQMFAHDCGRYPTVSEGLEALKHNPAGLKGWKGPYAGDSELLDPWQRPYVYRYPGQHRAFDILSFGADGVEGGNGDSADVGNWSRR